MYWARRHRRVQTPCTAPKLALAELRQPNGFRPRHSPWPSYATAMGFVGDPSPVSSERVAATCARPGHGSKAGGTGRRGADLPSQLLWRQQHSQRSPATMGGRRGTTCHGRPRTGQQIQTGTRRIRSETLWIGHITGHPGHHGSEVKVEEEERAGGRCCQRSLFERVHGPPLPLMTEVCKVICLEVLSIHIH